MEKILPVAWMERSGIQGSNARQVLDSASLHPGYNSPIRGYSFREIASSMQQVNPDTSANVAIRQPILPLTAVLRPQQTAGG